MPPEAAPSLLAFVPLLLAVGGTGGFLSGLLGVGGGIVFVPGLYFTLSALGADPRFAMHVTVGTSLAIIMSTTATSALGHYRRGAVDTRKLRSWGPFIVLGVLAGSALAGAADGGVLKILFACLTLAISAYMALGRQVQERPGPAWLGEKAQRAACVFIGMGCSMAGMGGGVLTVPLMVYSGAPLTRGVGTGAALGMLIAVPAVLGYIMTGWPYMRDLPPFSLGYVNPAAAGLCMAAAIPMARLGVRVSHGVNRLVLRRVFAVVLVAVSTRMFMSL